MITDILFSAVAIVANCLLYITLYNFIPFLSSQDLKVNDTDASTFSLFTIDVCLVLLFMAQHSLLATKTYRIMMENLGCQPVARSVYTLTTALVMQVLMSYWQPITEVQLWQVDTGDRPLLWLFFHLLHWLLWSLVFLQASVTQPLLLLGVKQVYYYVKGWYPPSHYLPPQMLKLLSHMPHPGAGCFIAVLWVHPAMTYDRLILATVLTSYLCCQLYVSERDYEYVGQCSETTYVTTRTSSRRKTHAY